MREFYKRTFYTSTRCLNACQVLAMVIFISILYINKTKVNLHLPATIKHIKTMQEKILSMKVQFNFGFNSETSWLALFPNMNHLISIMESKSQPLSIEQSTSASHTTIVILGKDYKVGDTLVGLINAKDHKGNDKEYGGDFFTVVLRRLESDEDRVSCEVLDLTTGSYDVKCLLPWSGRAVLNATLVHPSEGIYYLIKTYSSRKEYGVRMNTTMVNSKKVSEFTDCSVGFPEMRYLNIILMNYINIKMHLLNKNSLIVIIITLFQRIRFV